MMNTGRNAYVLLVALLWVQQYSRAHTTDSLCNMQCGCHSRLTPAGIMLGHLHDKNQWMFSYRYMHMQMNGTVSGTQALDKTNVFNTYIMSPEKMRMNMHMVMVMYGATDRLTFMLMGNFTSTSMSMAMFSTHSHQHNGSTTTGSSTHQMSTKGLGDIELHALLGIIKNDRHQLISSLGVNIPAGSVEFKGKNDDMLYANQRLPYNMQAGTGSFDLMPCLSYLYQDNQFSFGSQALATLRPWTNKIGYSWGNEFTLNTWAGYYWWGFLGTSVRLEAQAAGYISGYDPSLYPGNEPAANTYNYGGKKMNVYGGLCLRAKKGAWSNQLLAFEYGYPVYQDLNGIQMPVTQLINAAWSLTF